MPSTKMIELSNPSAKKAGYTVCIDGSNEFSTTAVNLIVPAESSISVPLTLTPGAMLCVHDICGVL